MFVGGACDMSVFQWQKATLCPSDIVEVEVIVFLQVWWFDWFSNACRQIYKTIDSDC